MSSEESGQVAVPEGVLPLVKKLAGFCNSTELSDFTIHTQSRHFRVHRIILSLHSKALLANPCDGDFCPSELGSITYLDDDNDCVEAMVEYLYNFDYDVRNNMSFSGPEFHVHMALLADKYGISALKSIASTKCKMALESDSDNAPVFHDTICLAYRFASSIPELCASLVTFALGNTDIGIGDTINPELEKLMTSTPDLAIDITKAMHARMKAMEETTTTGAPLKFVCPACSNTQPLPTADSRQRFACLQCGVRTRRENWPIHWASDAGTAGSSSSLIWPHELKGDH